MAEEPRPLNLVGSIRDTLAEIKADVHELRRDVVGVRLEVVKLNASSTREDIEANTNAIAELTALKNRVIGYGVGAGLLSGSVAPKLFALFGG